MRYCEHSSCPSSRRFVAAFCLLAAVLLWLPAVAIAASDAGTGLLPAGPTPGGRDETGDRAAALRLAAASTAEAGRAAPEGDVDSLKAALTTLIEVVEWLHHSYVDSLSPDFLLQAAVEGICRRLDPQTSMLSPLEWERLIESTSSGYVGIGVGLDFGGRLPLVRAVQTGSPAQAAGIRPGDSVLRVGPRAVAGLDQEQVTRLIRGPRGSSLHLEILSPGDAHPHAVVVGRERLELADVESTLLGAGRIGYLRILRFGVGTAAAVRDALDDWNAARGLSGLLIDLRGNPGGLFDEAAVAADLFLPTGVEIVRTGSRLAGERETIHAAASELVAGLPVAILVDSLTASSAEVFAGALQGNGAAVVAGEPSYGKRTIQRFKPLGMGGALRLTTSRFETPADVAFEGPASADGVPLTPAARRHARLVPDLVLLRDPVDPRLAACDSLGLIARFVALPTLSARDRAAWPAWAGDRPADWRAFAASAPGFETWRARLLERLGAWDSPSVPDLSAPGADLRLKSLWIADWVAERWGEENLLAASMEIDPWVASAIDRLIEPHTAQAPRDLRPAE